MLSGFYSSLCLIIVATAIVAFSEIEVSRSGPLQGGEIHDRDRSSETFLARSKRRAARLGPEQKKKLQEKRKELIKETKKKQAEKIKQNLQAKKEKLEKNIEKIGNKPNNRQKQLVKKMKLLMSKIDKKIEKLSGTDSKSSTGTDKDTKKKE